MTAVTSIGEDRSAQRRADALTTLAETTLYHAFKGAFDSAYFATMDYGRVPCAPSARSA